MTKKLISLLVAICLVIGLLPVMSIADLSEPATAKIGIMKGNAASEITVTEGGEAYYLKSVPFTGYTNSTSTNASGTAIHAICADGSGAINVTGSTLELTSTGTAFNKAPVLSAGWTDLKDAGDDNYATGDTDVAIFFAKNRTEQKK